MSDRKYVIFVNGDTGKEYAVLFDRDLSHSAVARGVTIGMADNDWGPRLWLEAVSAGFVTDDLTVILGNGSESLKLEPRAQDQEILRPTFRPPLIVTADDGFRKVTQRKPPRSFLERARSAKARP